jgi:spore coat polysaccharide biosynthesis protein SpsF
MSAVPVLIVLQSRMASTRLPGKALLPLAGRPLLAHCISRLQSSGFPVVVATTRRRDDDAIVDCAAALGTDVLRGPESDVLGRFVMAIDRCAPDYIIRATADNPCVDAAAPARLLAKVKAANADHGVESGLPYGCAVEVIRADALRVSSRCTYARDDREHVTTFIRRHPRLFRAIAPASPPVLNRPDLRLTVDTPADYQYVSSVFDGAWDETLRELIAAADALNAASGAA